MTSLVFKFRDDLLLDSNTFQPILPKLTASFYTKAAHYFVKTQAQEPLTYQQLLKSKLSAQLTDFKQIINELIDHQPVFLFEGVDLNSFHQLCEKQVAYLETKVGNVKSGFPDVVAGMPNFFNYFQIEFSDYINDFILQDLLSKLEPLLPHKQKTNYHLLQYAYLKDDPVPLSSYPTAREARLITGTTQTYFGDMGIPSVALAAHVPNVALTVVEAGGWDLTHPQFSTITTEAVLMSSTALNVLTDVLPAPINQAHGTQILGIIGASRGDRDDDAGNDLCRGIVSNVTVRLASCIKQVTARSVLYAEEIAVLVAVLATQSGETILIEVGTAGGLFPLDIQPAVYELINVAFSRGITVVQAAGNGQNGIGAVLNTLPADVVDPLMPRDLRASKLRYTLAGHSQSHWNAYTATFPRIADIAARNGVSIGPLFKGIDDFLGRYQETPSKSILVGSTFRSNSPTNRFTVMPASSRGNRVRVFAQGNNILTTTELCRFTDDMGSTSGAAAIVAGIVLLAQQTAIAKGRRPISPGTMGSWLATGPGVAMVSSGVVPSCADLLRRI
ncbi:S8 family serine peptidase [Fibrella forsythiae]|uniref:Peptidase S8/S53 domain-containing protein n=1 Tax=Fibrella forsythiae TaxID=2817061 RepID=A0ABS3JC56_9BACT|nr:S8 family serine peptidase [Fibrella forsythiae]MBO0947568.1 hypothetical protein [Fibrella forsythiae]